MARTAKVRVDIKTDIPPELKEWVTNNEATVAGLIETEAKNTSLFADKTGKLRKKIKAKKSKFKDGGYIVEARAPHAHLVEFGHDKILWGKATGERVQPYPFLRTAKEKVIMAAKAIFEAK